jgi:hypothetical protein
MTGCKPDLKLTAVGHMQAALNMALLSLLKDKVAKFDLARQEIVH